MTSSRKIPALAFLLTSYGFACQAQNVNTRPNLPTRRVNVTAPRSNQATPEKVPAVRDAQESASSAPRLEPAAPGKQVRPWRFPSIGRADSWLSVGSVDPGGRWVFFCESEENLDMKSVLARTRGARSAFLDRAFVPHFAYAAAQASPADALLAASPNGRFVVLVRGGQPELFDAEAGTTRSLANRDIDLRADVLAGDLRSVAFSPASDKLAFIVHEKQPRVVVLNLGDATETEVIPATTTVWRIAFDASGAYLVLQEVPEDSNQNGRFTWPYPAKKLVETRCRTPIPAFAAYVPTGDASLTSVAPVSGGKARFIRGFISGLGHGVVVRAPDGTLTVIEGSRVNGFGSPGCDAQIVAIAPNHGKMLVGCRDTNGRARLEIDSLSTSQKLDLDVPNSSADQLMPEPAPFSVVYSGAHTALIEWSASRVFPLEDRDQVLAQGQAGVVVRRGSKIVLYAPGTNRTTLLLDGVPSGARVAMGEGVVVIGNVILSANQGSIVGNLPKPALAVDSSGCGLVSLSNATNDLFARGPLGWVCPGD